MPHAGGRPRRPSMLGGTPRAAPVLLGAAVNDPSLPVAVAVRGTASSR